MNEPRKIKKHTLEEKLQLVDLHNQGFSGRRISSKLSICNYLVKKWLNIYKTKGISGLNKQIPNHTSPELKIKIVKEVIDKHLSYESISLKYPVSSTSVYNWVTKVKKYGYSSLMEVKQRGRAPKNMGRPKTKSPQTEVEKLQAEVEYLKAENAYLKN